MNHDPTSAAAGEKADADSLGPLDPTHPPGTAADPAFAAPAHQGEVGTFGRYRVLQKLGQGGMGAVYLGYDTALDRKVALKVMLPHHAADAASRERFLREARSAAKVHSDHVVTIHDVGEERGAPFIAMEYLLGTPLDRFLRTRGELPLDQVLRVGREVALGLAAAHDRGLVHRDIKPGNIWLEAPKGRVKLLDFGLARAANDDEHLTGSGAVIGTPAYMSPEQGRGLRVDHRTDLFSLGVVLYRLCTGKMPFTGAGAMAVLTSLAVDTPAAPRALNPHLPEAVEAIITRLLAKNPAGRFQTAQEVADALQAAAAGPLPTVVAIPVPLAVGAQTQNVWEGIDDSHSVAVPLTEGARAEVERASGRRAPTVPVALSLAAVLAAVGVVAAVLARQGKKPEPARPSDHTKFVVPTPEHVPPPPKQKRRDEPRSDGGKVYDLPDDLIPPMTAVRPKEVVALDHLDPADPKYVPPEEKYGWQPDELVAVLGSHRQRTTGPVTRLDISPDGREVATWGGDVLDVATGRPLDRPPTAVYAPDGRRGAFGAKVRDLAGPKGAAEQPAGGQVVAFLAGDIVLTAHDRAHVAWKLGQGGPKYVGRFDGLAAGLAVSANRKYMALALADGTCTVCVITADGPREKFALPGPEGQVRSFGGSPQCVSLSDAGLLAAFDRERAVRVWDVSGPEPRLRHTIDDKLEADIVCLSAGGEHLFRAGHNGFELQSLAGERPRKVGASWDVQRVDSPCLCLAVTPDGGTAVTGHANGTVRSWGIEKGVIVGRDPPRPQLLVSPRLDFAPDGRSALLLSGDGPGRLWRLADLSPRPLPIADASTVRYRPDGAEAVADVAGALRLYPAGDALHEAFREFAAGHGHLPLCYSPDGRWLATRHGGDLHVWDVSGPTPRGVGSAPGLTAATCRFTPDGRFLIAAAPPPGDGVARVWAMTPRGPVLRCEVTVPCGSAAVSPDGTAVVFCRGHGPMLTYAVRDGVLEAPRESAGVVGWADFSPDGRLLLVGGGGAGLRLLDPATGAEVRGWPLRGQPLGGRFHSDGRHVFVTNADGTTYILRMPKEMLERAADADRRAAEWVVERGGIVRVTTKVGEIKAVADLPAGPFRLTVADLTGSKAVTDAGLAVFEGCTDLTALSLARTAVTDAGLAHFRACQKWEFVSLGGTAVTDEGVAVFKHCKSLRTLQLQDTRIGDAGLSHFRGAVGLQYLALKGTRVTDAGLAHLSGCANLINLHLNQTAVSDDGLKNFGECKALELLQVEKTRVTREAASEFAATHPRCRITYDGGTIEPKK